MTNQTIDRVSRAALEILLSSKGGLAQAAAAHELRALLDAPACKECEMCDGSGRLGMGLCECYDMPAGQRQTFEQWFETGKIGLETELTTEALMEGAYIAGQQSAAQPAPVAVDRPVHATPPTGTEPCGTHHDNDGLEEWRRD